MQNDFCIYGEASRSNIDFYRFSRTLTNYPVGSRAVFCRTDSPIFCSVTVMTFLSTNGSYGCIQGDKSHEAVLKLMCFAATCFVGSSCVCHRAQDVADMVRICLSPKRLDSCVFRKEGTILLPPLSEQRCHLVT